MADCAQLSDQHWSCASIDRSHNTGDRWTCHFAVKRPRRAVPDKVSHLDDLGYPLPPSDAVACEVRMRCPQSSIGDKHLTTKLDTAAQHNKRTKKKASLAVNGKHVDLYPMKPAVTTKHPSCWDAPSRRKRQHTCPHCACRHEKPSGNGLSTNATLLWLRHATIQKPSGNGFSTNSSISGSVMPPISVRISILMP